MLLGLLRVFSFKKAKALKAPDLTKYLDIEYDGEYIKSINNKLGLLPVCHFCGKNAFLWGNPKKDVVIFACSADCLKILEEELTIVDFSQSRVFFDKKTLKQISKLNFIGRLLILITAVAGVALGYIKYY